MLPETDFHKRRSMMFLLVGGRYYPAANSSFVDEDYIELCRLRFPLVKGGEIQKEEEAYLKRNRRVLETKKAEIEQEVNKGKGIEELTAELRFQYDLNFFLTEICRPDNFHLRTRNAYEVPEFVNSVVIDSGFIFPQILNRDYAVINQRLYPLRPIDQQGFVYFGRRNFTFDPSPMTVSDVEGSFHEILLKRMRSKAIKDSEKVREIGQEILELDEKNKILQSDLGVSTNPHSYESGNIGFDKTLKAVYYLIPPHYNHTSGKSYSEGQSAATISFENKTLGNSGTFADRASRDHQFVRSSHSHCMGGLSLGGTTLEDKMFYLRKFAMVVYENGGFYQQENTSSDDYSGY